jgi:hypothetical protein
MDENIELLAEQLRHTIDLMKAEVSAVKRQAEYDRELMVHRIQQLEEARKDHESRLRTLQDGATSFKVWSGLASGGSSVMSLAAIIKTFFGI